VPVKNKCLLISPNVVLLDSAMSALLPTLAVEKTRRQRRQVAVPQAAIARAARVAEALGRHWHVEIDGDVVRLRQGEPPVAPVLPNNEFARGLGIVP
jgi:hypothetical protein